MHLDLDLVLRGGGGGASYRTGGQGCLRLESSGKATPAHNERFRVGVRPSSDCGLRPFGVAHGVGRCEVKVVGDHHSASAPNEGHQVANGDGRHVWIKLCTPTGLNLFEKPCSRL